MANKSIRVILIVDDSESDTRIYRRYLERSGEKWKVEAATTLTAALKFCASSQPDCVLLDFRLPDSVGLEGLEKIRKLVRGPIIFMSGNPEPAMVGGAFRAGAITYLSKDLLSQESLLDTLRKVMSAEGGDA